MSEQFGYDPGRGLFVPGVAPGAEPRYKAGPNPLSPPSIEPSMIDELRRVSSRTGRQLRFYWMKYDLIWGIQVLEPGNRWETICCNYDENGAWEKNPYPYRAIDKRFIDELCEADLKQKYGTGDIVKDHALRDADIAKKAADQKAKNFEQGAATIEAMVTGGDPRRFFRLLGHEQTHNGPGVKFTEYFQVARETPLPEKVTPPKE